MSYAGNFDTAQIYLKAGLKDRAHEYFRQVLAAIPQQEQTAHNVIYLRTLVCIARLSLERDDWPECVRCIERGLAVKPDHLDLIFLKALMYWDVKQYDEMFLTLIAYLSLLPGRSDDPHQYEYTADKTLAEVQHRLLPVAFKNSVSKAAFMQSIQTMANNGSNVFISRLATVLHNLESGAVTGESVQSEQANTGI